MTLTARPSTSAMSKDGAATRLEAVAAPMFGGELPVHALREHYVRTVDAWYATFDANWDRAVALVGEEVARVWRLYLVGGALAFEEGRMGVDQILMTRRTADGRSELPAVRHL